MTDADMINHLWTHKTQDHPVFSDEELMIERGEGVYIWTRGGQEADRRLRRARGGARRPRARRDRGCDPRAGCEARVLPDDAPVLEPSGGGARGEARDAHARRSRLHAVCRERRGGERALDPDRAPLLARGRAAEEVQDHLAPGRLPRRARSACSASAAAPSRSKPYEPYQVAAASRKVTVPYPFRDRGNGTDEDLVRRCSDALADRHTRGGSGDGGGRHRRAGARAPAAASSRRSAGSRACATSATTSKCS